MAVKALGATPTMQHLLRVAAVVAVLFGVLLMHSSPLLDHTGGHATESAHDSGAHGHSHEAAAAPMALGDLPVALAGTGCEGTDCGDHTGLHLCMAVMTIAAALVLARWYATAAAGEAAVHGLRAQLRIHAGRAPPWTTPTLAQLSVLRV
ncbi:putative membrane protein [Rhodococcus wratislaviensis IFP 2016]|nr:putative membrane protein [Rhodococcus wratislaviensis IFP 2016]